VSVREVAARAFPTAPLALSVAALLAIGVVACGAGRRDAAHAAQRMAAEAAPTGASTRAALRDDGDADGASAAGGAPAGRGADADADGYGQGYYDWDDEHVLDYGRPARAAEAASMIAAVRRYYATAAAGDGAGACRELSAGFAASVASTYRGIPGLPKSGARSCGTTMTALLRDLRPQLSKQRATLKTGVARVEADGGRVLVGFEAAWPNRYLQLRRERGAWKIAELEAGALP
jgi:hypothetical protein